MQTIEKPKTASSKIWLPTLEQEVVRPWFLVDVDMLAEHRRILSSCFFLIRQGDAFGERLKCTRCQARHDYITLNCVERPFNGLVGGLYAYYQAVRDNGLEPYMNPKQRQRYSAVRNIIDVPSFGASHPETARTLTAQLGTSDAMIGAVSLGVLEGIAEAHARQLERRINDRGIHPRFMLGTLSDEELKRAERYRRGL